MNKLRVYGCSFSCAFQDLKQLPPIETEEGWPQIVANTIGYKYVDRAEPGYGLNHILFNLEEDLYDNLIDKNDIIILSPSYFQRITFPEIDEKLINQEWVEFSSRYSVNVCEVISINVMRFCYKMLSLRRLGYKIYGWCWTDLNTNIPRCLEYLNKICDYIIYAPNKRLFWEDWILENPECMLIPGEKKSDGAFTGDTHFSKYGHKVAAKHFIKELKQKEKII